MFGELSETAQAFVNHWTGKVLRSRHYKGLFLGDNGQVKRDGEVVLADLRDFCRVARGTIFENDPHLMARWEGRREVFVRIASFLNLDEAEVSRMMTEQVNG